MTHEGGNNVRLDIVRELDGMVASHIRWLNEVNQALICGTQIDPGTMQEDAHRCCDFGTWYYGTEPSQQASWPEQFEKVGIAHKQMHYLAQLLLQRAATRSITADDYDRFSAAAYCFKANLRAFQFKLITDACLVDHLTGAWNRNSLMQKISEEYDRMVRSGETSCLCMMDLDHFKSVNDEFGHSVGDLVLQGIVNTASRSLRRYDSLIRYGGEEFLFCLPNIALKDAITVMERVRHDIEETPIALKNGGTVSVSASFGVAEMLSVFSIEENIELADHALLRAKATGRNRVCSWANPSRSLET